MRKFRLQMTVSEQHTQTIFDLLHDVAQDFKMIELGQEGQPQPLKVANGEAPTAYQAFSKEKSGRWAERLWPMIQPIFAAEKSRGDGLIRFDDPRLREVVVKAGNAASTVHPLLSELRRQGKLTRPHRGWYMLSP